jgi:hypothetical protein
VNQLAEQVWPTPPAIAHSGLGDRYLQDTLRFKSGDRDILLMTRDLWKRGLDFPMARSLVLYSPKSSARTRHLLVGGHTAGGLVSSAATLCSTAGS